MINSLVEAVTTLQEKFPHFSPNVGVDDRMSYDSDLPYLVFGDFSIFLRRRLIDAASGKISKDDQDIVGAFCLIGMMLQAGRPDLDNLLEVGILEGISDLPLAREIAHTSLSHNLVKRFDSLMPSA